jgi:hypothetical protein
MRLNRQCGPCGARRWQEAHFGSPVDGRADVTARIQIGTLKIGQKLWS